MKRTFFKLNIAVDVGSYEVLLKAVKHYSYTSKIFNCGEEVSICASILKNLKNMAKVEASGDKVILRFDITLNELSTIIKAINYCNYTSSAFNHGEDIEECQELIYQFFNEVITA